MIDSTTIITIVTLAGSSVGTFAGILITNKLTLYRISQLEKKVDKHNTVIERTFVLEGNCKVLKQEIDNLKCIVNG